MCDAVFTTVAGSGFSQDSVTPPLPAVLMDCYYLEEWERLQGQWEEFNRQRRSFQRERQAFTEAAIRLGREVKFDLFTFFFGNFYLFCLNRLVFLVDEVS